MLMIHWFKRSSVSMIPCSIHAVIFSLQTCDPIIHIHEYVAISAVRVCLINSQGNSGRDCGWLVRRRVLDVIVGL